MENNWHLLTQTAAVGVQRLISLTAGFPVSQQTQ